jgi:hypothetical protein
MPNILVQVANYSISDFNHGINLRQMIFGFYGITPNFCCHRFNSNLRLLRLRIEFLVNIWSRGTNSQGGSVWIDGDCGSHIVFEYGLMWRLAIMKKFSQDPWKNPEHQPEKQPSPFSRC